MAKLIWDQVDQRHYEYGVDRGVFYPSDGPGVVWNGLIKVTEESDGGDGDSYHYDGIKYLDIVNPSTYKSTISAYSTPVNFEEIEGYFAIIPGFILTRQAKLGFGLCYRTFVGDDASYKIHLVYNALATATGRTHTTMTDGSDPATLEWDITAIPPVAGKYRPSPHYILDSNEMNEDALSTLEEILYGSDELPARLPNPWELLNIAINWEPLLIREQIVTGLAELVPGLGDLYESEIAGLNRTLPETRLVQTLIRGLYRLE